MTEKITTTLQENPLKQAAGLDHELKLARTVGTMERLRATEIFATPEQSKAFLDSLDYDDFKKYISFINGVERGIPSSERGKVSNSHTQSENDLMGAEVEYRPPHQSFRDHLLKKAFEKAQNIEEPELAGLTLGLSINAIHYFADGNGRTARMAYALLSKGYDGSPEHQEYYSALLENTKGREVVNPNPASSGIDRKIRAEMTNGIRRRHGYEEALGDNLPTFINDGYPDAFAGEYSPEELAVADDIDAQGRRMLYYTMESGGMEMISLMATFKPERVKEFIKTSSDGKRTYVDGNEFLPTLTKEEISHWYNTSERAIATYVMKLIDVADRDDASKIAAHYTK